MRSCIGIKNPDDLWFNRFEKNKTEDLSDEQNDDSEEIETNQSFDLS